MTDYKNQLPLNNGYSVKGAFPLDDREVFSSIEDLYISRKDKTHEKLVEGNTLYNRVYPGMTVKVWMPADGSKAVGGKGEYKLFTCIDNRPYLTQPEPAMGQQDLVVSARNFSQFWKEETGEVADYINNVVNTSVNKVENFLKDTNNLTADAKTSGLKITTKKGNAEGFIQYQFAVQVDNQTIAIGTDNKLNTVEYRLAKLNPANDGYLISYQLQRKRPNETEFKAIDSVPDIDIQKDMVLKEVHLCKATYDEGTNTYTETVISPSPDWDTAAGDPYLHFTWNTKAWPDGTSANEEDKPKETETYLKVADIIKLDVADMKANLARLDVSVNFLESYVQADNITENTDGAINIVTENATAGSKGKSYKLAVKVDNDTIKVIEDNITGGKYQLEKLETPNENSLVSYKLAYKGPGETAYVRLENCSIDVPKDFVVKEVHYCKATEAGGVYTETARPSDSNWKEAAGDVYLHFVWHTKDSDSKTSETWVKISDLINIDLTDIREHLDNLDASVNDLREELIKDEETWAAAMTVLAQNLYDTSVVFGADIKRLNTSVNLLEGKGDSLQSEVNKLNSSVNALETNAAILNSSVSALEVNADTLNSSVNSLEENADTLNTSVNALEANASVLNSSVSALENNASILNSSVSALEVNADTLNTSVNALEANAEVLNSSVSALENNASILNSSVSALEANAKVLNSSVSSLENNASILNSSVSALEANAKVLNSSVSALEVNADTLNTSVNYLEEYVQSDIITEKSNGALEVVSTSAADGVKGKSYTLAVKVDADAIKVIDDKITGGKYQLEKLDSPLEDALASYQLAYKGPGETAYTKLTNCTVNIPKDFVVKEVHYCKATEAGGVYTETAQPTDGNWSSAAGDVYLHFIWQTKGSGSKTSESWIKISDLIKVDLDYIDKHLEELDSSVTTLKSDVNRLNTSVNALETNVKTLNASTNTLEAGVAKLNSSVNALESNAEILNSSVSALETNVKTLNASTNTLEAGVAKLNSSVNTLESDMTRANSSINSLESNVSTLKSDMTKANSSINALETNVKTLNASTNTLEAGVAKLNSSVNTLESNVSTLQSDMTKANSSINSLESGLSKANSSINSLETNVKTLNASTNTLEADVAKLNSSVNTLESDMTRANSSINSLESNVSTLKSDMTKANSSINSLESGLSKANSSINSLESDVNTLEGVDQSLQNQIDALFTELGVTPPQDGSTTPTPPTPGESTGITSRVSGLETSVNDIEDSVGTLQSDMTKANSSVNYLEQYVQSTNIANAANGAVTVTPSAGSTGCKGNTYTIKVNVDDDSVKVVSDKLKVGKYKLKKLSTPTAGMLNSYRLVYTSPEGTESELTDATIDIAKDYVLKEVHLCKATTDGSTVTETKRFGQEGFDTAAGDYYLHFIWQTKDSDATVSETYLKVNDFINGDLTEIYEMIRTLDASVKQFEQELIDNELTWSAALNDLNSRHNDLSTYVQTLVSKVGNVETLPGTVTGLESNVTTLESTVNDLSSNFNNLKSDLATANSSINRLETNLETLEGTVDDISTDVNDLKTDMATANSSVNGLETEVEDLGSTVEDLSTKFASAPKHWCGTKDEYDLISVKDDNTFYFIIEE